MAKAKQARKRAPGRVSGKVKGGVPAYTALYVACSKLTPYARNAQIHTPAQVAAIVKSIQRFGFTNPVLADADGILAGHGRVLAAERIYAEGGTIKLPNGEAVPAGCVPVVDCNGWGEDERRAYILADNQLGRMADTDDEILREELAYLSGADDLAGIAGFDDTRIAEVVEGGGGWHSDIAQIEKAGAHTDGITARIVVLCPQDEAEKAKAAIQKTLDRLKIDGAKIA